MKNKNDFKITSQSVFDLARYWPADMWVKCVITNLPQPPEAPKCSQYGHHRPKTNRSDLGESTAVLIIFAVYACIIYMESF